MGEWRAVQVRVGHWRVCPSALRAKQPKPTRRSFVAPMPGACSELKLTYLPRDEDGTSTQAARGP